MRQLMIWLGASVSVIALGSVVVLAAFVSFFTPASCMSGVQRGPSSEASIYFASMNEKDSAERQKVAALIVQIGEERNFSSQSITIAVATAIQESDLTNLPYLGEKNDHNSRGIYQQQPSPEWGTADEVQDPVHAINAFYDGLEKVSDRDNRPMMDVAIQVQRPDPSAYRKSWAWDTIAQQIVATNVAGSDSEFCSSTADGWQPPLEKSYIVTSPYGMRLHPIYRVYRMHNGIDFSGAQGTPVYAVQDGTVDFAGPSGGYGNFIRLNHGNDVFSSYAHLSAYAIGVEDGALVKAGQLIGEVGTTGASDGPHLHFEMRANGEFVDPDAFMNRVGVDITP